MRWLFYACEVEMRLGVPLDGIVIVEAQLGVSLNEVLETAVAWHEAQ